MTWALTATLYLRRAQGNNWIRCESAFRKVDLEWKGVHDELDPSLLMG